MHLKKIIEITEGKPLTDIEDINIENFVIDSREVKEGDFFVPINKGHFFIEDALKNGAVSHFTENKDLRYKNSIYITNSIEALKKIGIYKRKSLKATIGITGTSGKTTTKELLHFVLKNIYNSYATKGNYNNEIGVPLTLANIPDNTEIGIFEMGASKIGDIEYLNNIVNQDIGVLVSVGYGHVEKFGSFENVIKGKGEIFNNTKYQILPYDLVKFYNDKLKNYITFGEEGDIKVRTLDITEKGTTGIIKYKNQEIILTIPVYNKALFHNIGAVSAVLYALDLDPIKNLKYLKDFKAVSKRGEIYKLNNLTIIDDSYNANPLSVKNAIDTLSKMKNKKIFVFGDMLELGEESEKLHKEIGEYILDSNIDMVLLYGKEVIHTYEILKGKIDVWIFDNKKDIAEFIKNIKEEATILVKASRGMKMEEIIEKLL
ncbi:UDP-N-acetylmuramoyl-tripeptide--D-alanyl-D-alanine ligase [Venenivibrio stagnispumantis]|uniref:UDP-N-acetylmuramoyl-tripeptide--D-alanyl-D-alanine ligase n=1 Tax=Venenivibrio stagnispumantis TaxID=407998 RepID=A0AA46AES2_9AQUI|nr:UDP-N-acetylmuramoyl-tripeptide--D-alanyl-D-alanine ligase [Venenivibrio stagnispumantis]MCW4573641.1 UDP-N-acetylmuramoyl-tripeptide--D-alanyl-D-alanine ligase [Venenivibrio stagnispumantis]SMP14372.1 UDP-N-acetylmuramoyl-tripeptide--D-alanyl-D-alanine ligase [Venenivibrio stagnispumantis]